MAADEKFWDKIADSYAKRPVSDEAAFQKKLEITRGYLKSDMDVLEIGCGTGSTALVHAPHVRHIRAVDVSSRMLEIARAKAEAQSVENITFERAEIDELEAVEGSYDMVMAHSVLHLLEDKEAVIAAIHRMLKPGGLFVSSTTCLGDFLPVFKYIVPIGRMFGKMPLVKVFKSPELLRSIEAAGFAIEQQWHPGNRKAIFVVARKAA